MSKTTYFQSKMEKNTFNNYLRVKLTSNHQIKDRNGFSGSKNIRKNQLFGDLMKNIFFKMAAAAILNSSLW